MVEAGRRSGTLSTAAAARQLLRPVMAVPGPVTSALSVGCHLLITEHHALLVTDAQDVLRILRGPHSSGGLLPYEAANPDGPGFGGFDGFDVHDDSSHSAEPVGTMASSRPLIPTRRSTGWSATLAPGSAERLFDPPASVAAGSASASAEASPDHMLDAESNRVLDALSARISRSVSEIARSSAVPHTAVMAALGVLDMLGLACRSGDGWRRTRRQAGARR